MSDQQDQTSKTGTSANKRVVIACSAFVVSMVGVSYAAVPLYKLFCQVTGYGGTTQRVEQMSDTILDRTIKVRFDANVAAGLPWKFKPVEREVEVRIGETIQIDYTAENISDANTYGQATFNVTPMSAGAFFNKIQCFCFTETELKPGEIMNMPVVFFRRSGDRQRSGRQECHHNHAVLHFLPSRIGKTRCGDGGAGARQQHFVRATTRRVYPERD